MQRRSQRRMRLYAARTRWTVALAVACGGLFAALLATGVLWPSAPREEAAGSPATTAANLFVSMTGSDANPCTQAAPCRTFNRAYAVARGGNIIEVAGGTYPTQALRGGGAKSAAVVFQPAPGATVRLGDPPQGNGIAVNIGVSHIEIRDMGGGVWETTTNGLTDITLRHEAIGSFFLDGVSNTRVLDSSIGPANDSYNRIGGSDVLVEGNRFHDFVQTSPDVHMECLQVNVADGVTIRGNRFENCAVFDIFVTRWGTGPPEATKNITIENNFLGHPTAAQGGQAFYSIFGATAQNLVVRYNSALGPFAFESDSWGPGPTKLIANVAPNPPWGCDRSGKVKYRDNVWDGVACSHTDQNAPSGFVDPARLDLHLRAGAAAIDRGDPSDRPRTDIDGEARSKRPDAGADERR